MTKYLLAFIFFAASVLAQTPYQIPNAPQQVIQIYGSSTVLYAQEYAAANLPNLWPSATIKPALWFSSRRCGDILPFVSTQLSTADTVVMLEGVGIVDVENRADGTRNSTPVATFMACATQLTQAIISHTNPSVIVVWTTVNPINIAATNMGGNSGPYTDPRDTLAAYNSAITDPVTGLAAQFPQNVVVARIHDLLTDSNGWALTQYITWTDPNQSVAWPIIYGQISSVLYGGVSEGVWQ